MIQFPFLFARHGETDWNALGRPQGQLETRLNAEGHAQTARLVTIMAHVPLSKIAASPMARVRQTAEPVAALRHMSVQYLNGLKECHLGEGQGTEKGPWLKQYWKGERTPLGAEPFTAFAERAFAAICAAVDRSDVLIVAHGGVWRALLAHIDVTPKFWMANAVPVRVTPEPNGPWRVETVAHDAKAEADREMV